MKVREKSPVLDAHIFRVPTPLSESPRWVLDAIARGSITCHAKPEPHFIVKTQEGPHHAELGDVLLKDAEGRLSVLSPDEFAAKYEMAQ